MGLAGVLYEKLKKNCKNTTNLQQFGVSALRIFAHNLNKKKHI